MLRRLLRQAAAFTLVGMTSAVIDLGTYFTLTRTIPIFHDYYIATSFGTGLLAITVGFLINSRWTFRAGGEFRRHYPRYLTIYLMGAVWQNVLLTAFVEYGNLPDWIAKPIAIVIVAYGWNFLLAKFWVFRYTRKESVAVYGETDI